MIGTDMKTERSVRRFDLGELRKATKTPQGFLMVPGFATRTGVFPYRDEKGRTRFELRHPDDVMDPESLKTLKYAPVTIEHPPEMVTPMNVGQFSVGHTTERVEVNRDMVETDLIVEHQDGIDAIEKDGIRELSCGYEADIVEESGDYNGARYDFRQKNIRYNHLAMVKRGRAGPEVRLRVDSADAAMELPKQSEQGQETSVVDSESLDELRAQIDELLKKTGGTSSDSKRVVVNGREVDLPSDVADTVQEMLDRYDEMRGKLYQLEDEMSKRTDVDVSQGGISPQVKVEQMGPDGRKAPAKVGAADTGGAAAAKGDAEAEEKAKKDAEEEAKKKDAEAGLAALKKDMDEMEKGHKDKMDAMQAKIDEMAAASIGKPEKKPDSEEGKKMDSADMQKAIRARAKLERTAEKLLPFEVAKKFDSMSDDEIRSSVIKHKHPKANLENASEAYLRARFDSISEASEEESDGSEVRRTAGRAMLGVVGTSGRMDSETREDADPERDRLQMIKAGRELWKQPLSASKK